MWYFLKKFLGIDDQVVDSRILVQVVTSNGKEHYRWTDSLSVEPLNPHVLRGRPLPQNVVQIDRITPNQEMFDAAAKSGAAVSKDRFYSAWDEEYALVYMATQLPLDKICEGFTPAFKNDKDVELKDVMTIRKVDEGDTFCFLSQMFDLIRDEESKKLKIIKSEKKKAPGVQAKNWSMK